MDERVVSTDRKFASRVDWNLMRTFVDIVRAGGIGAAAHLTTELFMSMTGVKMNHVPYKGDAGVLADLDVVDLDGVEAGLYLAADFRVGDEVEETLFVRRKAEPVSVVKLKAGRGDAAGEEVDGIIGQ